MLGRGVYKQIRGHSRNASPRCALQLRGDIRLLDQKIDSLKGELVAEIRRLDARVDGLDRELRPSRLR
jgi:hypothetical protein